ncbi:MAG TPA: hypothetical protein VN751_14365 [Solirubrobacteraceae bacterium]|nr:hypothetical protein [Solirubrobacteraceae bacterium]
MYATRPVVLPLARAASAAAPQGTNRGTLAAAGAALAVLAIASASLLALTRRMEREVSRH